MHEMSTCKQLIRQIEKLVEAQPNQTLKSITLSIGELARVDVDELVELFPIASQGTCAEHARLIINREPISIKCIACEQLSQVSAQDMNCPLCGSQETQLMGGTDMLLKVLEFV